MKYFIRVMAVLLFTLLISSCDSENSTEPKEEEPNIMTVVTENRNHSTSNATFSKLFSQLKGTFEINEEGVEDIEVIINIDFEEGIPKVGTFETTGFYNEKVGGEIEQSWAYGSTCEITSVSNNKMVGSYEFTGDGVSSENLGTTLTASGTFEIEY